LNSLYLVRSPCFLATTHHAPVKTGSIG